MTDLKIIARQLLAIRAMVDATLVSLGLPENGKPAETKEELAVFGRKTIDAPGGEHNG